MSSRSFSELAVDLGLQLDEVRRRLSTVEALLTSLPAGQKAVRHDNPDNDVPNARATETGGIKTIPTLPGNEFPGWHQQIESLLRQNLTAFCDLRSTISSLQEQTNLFKVQPQIATPTVPTESSMSHLDHATLSPIPMDPLLTESFVLESAQYPGISTSDEIAIETAVLSLAEMLDDDQDTIGNLSSPLDPASTSDPAPIGEATVAMSAVDKTSPPSDQDPDAAAAHTADTTIRENCSGSSDISNRCTVPVNEAELVAPSVENRSLDPDHISTQDKTSTTNESSFVQALAELESTSSITMKQNIIRDATQIQFETAKFQVNPRQPKDGVWQAGEPGKPGICQPEDASVWAAITKGTKRECDAPLRPGKKPAFDPDFQAILDFQQQLREKEPKCRLPAANEYLRPSLMVYKMASVMMSRHAVQSLHSAIELHLRSCIVVPVFSSDTLQRQLEQLAMIEDKSAKHLFKLRKRLLQVAMKRDWDKHLDGKLRAESDYVKAAERFFGKSNNSLRHHRQQGERWMKVVGDNEGLLSFIPLSSGHVSRVKASDFFRLDDDDVEVLHALVANSYMKHMCKNAAIFQRALLGEDVKDWVYEPRWTNMNWAKATEDEVTCSFTIIKNQKKEEEKKKNEGEENNGENQGDARATDA